MSWDDTKASPDGTNDDVSQFLSSDWNAMVIELKKKIGTVFDQKRGSDCTGSSGNNKRKLTLSNTSITSKILILVNGRPLMEPDYSIAHNDSGSILTIGTDSNPIHVNNTDYITVIA